MGQCLHSSYSDSVAHVSPDENRSEECSADEDLEHIYRLIGEKYQISDRAFLICLADHENHFYYGGDWNGLISLLGTIVTEFAMTCTTNPHGWVDALANAVHGRIEGVRKET